MSFSRNNNKDNDDSQHPQDQSHSQPALPAKPEPIPSTNPQVLLAASLEMALDMFIGADQWTKSVEIVDRYRNVLLTNHAQIALLHRIELRKQHPDEDGPTAEVLTLHLELLKDVKEYGVVRGWEILQKKLIKLRNESGQANMNQTISQIMTDPGARAQFEQNMQQFIRELARNPEQVAQQLGVNPNDPDFRKLVMQAQEFTEDEAPTIILSEDQIDRAINSLMASTNANEATNVLMQHKNVLITNAAVSRLFHLAEEARRRGDHDRADRLYQFAKLIGEVRDA